MVEATFIASGKNMEEALNFACSLISKLIMGGIDLIHASKIDIFCDDENCIAHSRDFISHCQSYVSYYFRFFK